MPTVSVKWQKKVFPAVEIDTDQPVLVFKCQLYDLTGVHPERQQIMLKGGLLKDDADLRQLGLKEGQRLMLMGTADEILEAPKESPVFVEDLPEKEQGTCHLFTAHSHSTRSQHTLTVVLDHDKVSPFRFVNLKPYALQTLNKNVSLRTVVLDQLPVE
jgi:hypothetical protein